MLRTLGWIHRHQCYKYNYSGWWGLRGISPTGLCYPWHCLGWVYPSLDDFIPGCGPVAAGVIFCEFHKCLYIKNNHRTSSSWLMFPESQSFIRRLARTDEILYTNIMCTFHRLFSRVRVYHVIFLSWIYTASWLQVQAYSLLGLLSIGHRSDYNKKFHGG